MHKLLIFEQFFVDVLKTLLKVPPQQIIAKFDFHVQILLLLSLTFVVLKISYLIRFMLKNSKF
jgi:hypothetical protein